MVPAEAAPESRGGENDEESATRWALPTARRPVPELVEERVLQLLRAGDLKVGDRLPNEPELARLLGVGRSSVRTALQRLQGLGVVEVNRGRGWFVSGEPQRQAADDMLARMSGRGFDVVDVLEVRIALEGAAAALAAARAASGDLDRIAKRSRDHQEAPSGDRDQLLATDEAFHAAVVDASGNAYLQAIHALLTPLIADWRRDSFATPAIHDRSAIDHNQIVVQLRRRDEVGARLAMTSHLIGLYRDVLREAGADGDRVGAGADVATYVDVRDTPLWSPD